ncbi:testis-specific serine/threonine-protein kinase 2 [Aethina tumida]|uniref:testis-specific serine/threonine-protein kinase 2 n=1 Tax=Aethina tumida TaxID=116153 RepID=UPI00096B32F8|nr:testis-specific serine/threonine-protein kinase 2 [Aethina tumida]
MPPTKKMAETVTDSSSALAKVLGYTFGRTLGEGSYSKVRTAKSPEGKILACKQINKECAGKDFIERFLPRELGIICNIKHPHIVTVHKVYEIANIIYIFMDFCQNGDLLEYIRKNGNFSEKTSKELFRQVAGAVDYLHGLDLAHRDLKCENIMLMADNRVKLGDFGFARHCKTAHGEEIMSKTFCGSSAYAAPEIIQALEYEPKKYDMWAMGCILYIMTCASMPFDDSNIKKMIKLQLSRHIHAVIAKWETRTEALKYLLCGLLEPCTKERYTIEDAINSQWLKED